jgi:hypothetical protein
MLLRVQRRHRRLHKERSMRSMKMLGLLVVVAAALMAFTASASATTVTTPTGTVATSTIHWVNTGGHWVAANAQGTVRCSATEVWTVTNHGAGVTVAGSISHATYTGCTDGWTVEVVSAGSFQIHWTSGYNGRVTSSGKRGRWILHTIFGDIECEYGTENTTIGTFTGGSPATIDIEGSMPFVKGSALCGSGAASISGTLVATDAVYIDQ